MSAYTAPTRDERYARLKAQITAIPVAHQASSRKCPECGGIVDLHTGRRSGLCWYLHRHVSDCIFDVTGSRIHFVTREEAEQSEVIFKTVASMNGDPYYVWDAYELARNRKENKMAKKSRKKLRPQELPAMEGPGVAQVRIPAIDKFAKILLTAEEEFKGAKETRDLAKNTLTEKLRDHAEELGKNPGGDIVYRFDDLIVRLTHGKDKLTVESAAELAIEAEED